MSGAEHIPHDSVEIPLEHTLLIEGFYAIQKIMREYHDEHDVWSLTTEELEDSDEEFVEFEQEQRAIARKHLQSIFWDAMEGMYPSLQEAESIEERLEILDDIHVPNWSGKYTAAQYEADDGNIVSWTYSEVTLEGHGTTMLASIADMNEDTAKCYKIFYSAANMMQGVVETAGRDDPVITEMIGKLPIDFRYDFARVLNGNVEPNEMEMILAEIEIKAQDRVDHNELMAIINTARMEYEIALMDVESFGRDFSMKLADLQEMHRIIDERAQELGKY